MPETLEPTPVEAVIIGAGPVGLFQIFELGLLGIKAHIIDSLAQPGGQCTELYPDKPIYDIPALPICGAQELIDRLLEQAKPFHATFHLGQEVTEVQPLPNGKIGWRYDLAIREQWRQGPSTPEDLWPAWRNLSFPTLIVRGATSDILSPEAAQQMLAAQPHAREVEIPQAAHMVFEDNPDTFLAAVRAFLSGH